MDNHQDKGRNRGNGVISGRWRKILYTIGIILGIGLLAQQAWQGFGALQSAETCIARPAYLLVTGALYVAAYIVQMTAWALIMRTMGAPLPPQAVLEGYALAFLPRYIPGSLWGYLSRNEWLAQRHNVGYGVSTTASLLEAAMLLLTAIIVGALYWLPGRSQIITGSTALPLVTLAIVLIGITSVWLLWRLMPWLTHRMRRNNAVPMPALPLAWGLMSATTLLYLTFWAIHGAALIAVAYTLCGTITLASGPTIAAAALSWAIGFLIIFVPAGLGIREWSLSTLLVSFTAIPMGQATLIAVVSRFVLIVAEFIVLGLGLHTQLRARWHRWQAQKPQPE